MTDESFPEPTGIEEPERPGRRLSSRLRSVAVDTAPLRESPEYRRLYLGDAVSTIGTQMTAVVVPLQVFELTKSSLVVGLVSLAGLVPLIVFGLIGGSIADAMDRRKLLLVTSSGLALVSVLLFVQAALGLDQVWLLFVLVFLQAGLFAVDSPARRAVIPRLIPQRQIPAATALSQVSWTFAMVVGPVLAGGIVGAFGLSAAYGLDAVTFAAALWAIVSLRAVPPEGGGTAAGLRSVMEGLSFLRSRPVLLMTFAVDINAMVFGMPRALFPELALERFHGDSTTVGLMHSAVAVGALLGALTSGWSGRVRRQGIAVLVAVAAWGAAIVGFGLASVLWLGLLMLALAGAADMVSAVFRNAILVAATPDELRGRLGGVFIAVVAGGPRLGDVEAGAAASLVSAQFSVVSGGFACILGVVVLALLAPSFARYEAPDDG
ncbi:MAG TPA: MFS transporter [Frankiaceae bacterium]|nr:MFS transporter [Frankiaceae bacterium]